VHLTITRKRNSILGNYRSRHMHHNHRITVNGDLNKFAFLITLLHEIAHLLAFERYGHRIAPHGAEWKKEFGNVLKDFVSHDIFPEDLNKALTTTLQNPAASSCADVKLLRVLRNYDTNNKGVLVEELPSGALFTIRGGRVFRKGEKIKRRYRCEEIATKKIYLFSPVYEVEPLDGQQEL
jgi:SprT protein